MLESLPLHCLSEILEPLLPFSADPVAGAALLSLQVGVDDPSLPVLEELVFTSWCRSDPLEVPRQ